MKGAGEDPHHCRSIRSGTFNELHYSSCWPLRGRSFQDALRVFFQPIKQDDARLDFYAIYKKEATEYDTDYVKKYDEDLNTTLIFVRHPEYVLEVHLTCASDRLVFSPLSVLPSSSMSTRSSNPTKPSNL